MQASIPTEAGKGAASKSAPPTQAELAAAFPQLEILELIGQGGMGFVFKARQPKIERLVALKILPQSLAADPAFAERFTREGRVLARLNHPNIVTIHDFGQANGFFYLLMEFVDGVNLRQAMKVGRFTPAQALAIVPKICEALQFAHNEGVLHRDIKPENILLDSKGRVKIADFGIAKLVGADMQALTPSLSHPMGEGGAPAPGEETVQQVNLTETGKVLGTPHYMAPEQIEHPQDVDPRADIYSLGVVFYEMLTGELPIGRFAPPSEKSTVDPRVDEVVLHTLEKERERRTQTAGEVKTQVETITGSGRLPSAENKPAGVAAAPAMAKPDRFWQWFAVAVLALIMISVGSAALGLVASFVIPSFVKARHRAQVQHNAAFTQTNAVSDLVFGPVIERTINRASTGTNFLLSFKTGELRASPSGNDSPAVDIHRWAQREGLDAAVGILNGNNDVLTGFDMAALPAPAQCWEELTPAAAAARLEIQPASSFVIMLQANGSLSETCTFRTRDGGIGILQLMGYVSEPSGVKIRYKFVDRVPATTQTQSNAVATGSWAPTLFPGEKPDLAKILDEAKKLTATAHFEEALQRYLWHYHHAQELGDSYQNIVRLTSALSDWAELGRRYPKAKQALVEIRDNNTREITQGRGYAEMFHEVQAINRKLQDDDATYALFKTVRDSDPKLVEQSYYHLQDLLVAKGEYQWCLRQLGDPQGRFDMIRQGLDMDRDNQKRMAEMRQRTAQQMEAMNQKRGWTNSWSPPDTSEMMKKSAADRFVGQTRQLIEILVATDHKADAERIRDQASAILDDPRLKSSVDDAVQKVGK